MSKQFIIYFLTITIILSGCVSNTLAYNETNVINNNPKFFDFFSKRPVNKKAPKSRRCWSQISAQYRYRRPKTFILATGANTGELQKANQDARLLKRAMQKRFKVPNKQVCLLENVYRAEFEQALIDLRSRVNQQDLVIIIFSGHGSYVKDNNGDELDQYDDVLVTKDVEDLRMPARNNVVTDDRLVQLVNALPTQRVFTFLDACFSGGMNMNGNKFNQHIKSKFLRKGGLGVFKIFALTSYQQKAVKTINGVLFAAAKEHQTAHEDTRYGGIFTRTFLKHLKRHSRANLKRIFNYTAREIRKDKYNGRSQHPIILGNNISLAKKL